MIDKTVGRLKDLFKENKTKLIFVTGGVLSGLGKGLTTAAIGNLLSDSGKVTSIKCEGYLNVDPGTMNPTEHGEVFVLEDGEEADMDFGHYERLIGISCKKHWNITMGKVFQSIREREREGYYLGRTVQFVPHVTNLIKEKWLTIASEENSDYLLVEIGGTVGDIESELHIEAARQIARDLGRQNVMFIHLVYVPKPPSVKEFKTKPAQQSLIILRERGLTPNIIIVRSEEPVTDKSKEKLALFSGLNDDDIVENYNVNNIYEVPILFYKQELLSRISDYFNVPLKKDLSEWEALVEKINNPEKEITVGICGKYTDLEDSYASVVEALHHSGAHADCKINIRFIETTDIESYDDAKERLNGFNAIIVPGGFGSRGIEGKIRIIEYCRKNNVPFLGICYGLQLAVVEFARNVLGLKDANTTEVNVNTNNPVVDILPEQKEITSKGGTMRLGAYDAILKEGGIIAGIYESTKVSERHRHRYEVNPEYHKKLEENGMEISGLSPNGRLAEFIELKDHPYFVGSQGHIELKSSLIHPAPLFLGLVKAGISEKYDGIRERAVIDN